MENITTEENKVLALYMHLLEQWNKRTAAGMSGLFVENGRLIGFDGSQLNGQKEIYDVLDEIFSNFPTGAYVSIVKEVRLLTPDSGIVNAVVGMVPQGGNDIKSCGECDTIAGGGERKMRNGASHCCKIPLPHFMAGQK